MAENNPRTARQRPQALQFRHPLHDRRVEAGMAGGNGPDPFPPPCFGRRAYPPFPFFPTTGFAMLDFDEAQRRLAAAGKHPETTESCALAQANGRVLAEPAIATLDLPSADNSAMDGYAVRHADYRPGLRFPIQQRCFAGQVPEALRPGNAIRLFTGSLMPEGADTVVMQEDCHEADGRVEIRQAPRYG